jgi:hypothetical protein
MGSELLVESVVLLFYIVAAAVLTAGGLAAEYASAQHFGSGEVVVALWLAGLGAIMLYAGVYGIGYQKLLASVRSG